MRYRRRYISGGTYFITITLADRKSNLLTKNIDKLRVAFNKVKIKYPFHIHAIVVLPDHIHMLISLPDNDSAYSMRIRLIKTYFTRTVAHQESKSTSRKMKNESEIWQRRFWEHTIRNEKDYALHVHYIHYNPVKHKHVLSPIDWPYSSIHFYVRKGVLKADWSAAE